MVSVLFVCRDNAVRSPMAEACLSAIGGGRIEVASAGVHAAGLHPLTRVVLTEAGISARELHSSRLELCFGRPWDYLVTIGEEVATDPMLLLVAGDARRLHWEIADPAHVAGFAARLQAFRGSRDRIRRRVEGFVASIGVAAAEPALV